MRPALRLAGLLALTAGVATAAAPDTYRREIDAWHAHRVERLTAADSWLALIGRHPLEVGVWTVGSGAHNAIRLAAGPEQLGTITRRGDDNVIFTLADGVDGAIDGTAAREAPLAYGSDARPTYVRAGTINFYILEARGRLFLRVRDSESSRRRNFAGLERFPVDPAWRIVADWVPFDPPRQLPITNVVGVTEDAPCPGKAVFQHGGRTLELLPVQEAPGERLFFILTDATAGEETYEASRFLYADLPRDGKVVLDFNQLYNPPCAFTPFTTCPLPPRENRLTIPLRAGEKKYRGE